jgi:hypothetical protein
MRMRKHTYKAHKDKIKVENIITTLFKDLKIRNQKVLRKIEHACRSISLDDKCINLALEVKISFSNSTPTIGSNTESST